MGFSLLAPLFLLGAAAVAVPIIVHLVHRHRADGVVFPSLMFLRQIPIKTQRRQKIRHWVLFAMRCAALILFVLAFSRPFFDTGAASSGAVDAGQDIVVLLDRSYSMGYEDRWDRAIEATETELTSVGADDQISIVVFGEQAQALSQPTQDVAALRNALSQVTVGSSITRLEPALKIAQRMLEVSTQPVREVVIISDFQKSGWTGEADVAFGDDVSIRTIDLSTLEPANVAVADVSYHQEVIRGRERATFSARVINTGIVPAQGLNLSLELNGQEVQTATADIEPSSAKSIVFEPVLLPDATSRATVRVPTDRLPADNAFHLVLAPGQAISVLVLEGSSPRANHSLFLQQALAVGDQPPFRLDVKPLRQFQLSDVQGRAIIVLNDAPFPGGQAGQRMREFVAEGGGLLSVLGDRGGGWGDEAADLFPGTIGDRVERQVDRAGAVTHIDFGHPVFALFSGPRSGDLTSGKVFRYRNLVIDPGAKALARFDDGAVALAERRVGKGRVLVWTTTLDTYWNDLPIQPVFVPFVHQVMEYLAAHGEQEPWFTVGAVGDLARYTDGMPAGAAIAEALRAGAGVDVLAPDGERTRIDDPADSLFVFERPGFYEISRRARNAETVFLASNVDATESDLAPVDPGEVVAAIGSDRAGSGVQEATLLSIEEREQRQGIWWYLLVLAFILFAIETVVSNRVSRAARQVS